MHTHSVYSDGTVTPQAILDEAERLGLSAVALTDHNSAKNCPAFFEASDRYGVIPIAGMEVTTSEDIHVVCLFETLDRTLQFPSA